MSVDMQSELLETLQNILALSNRLLHYNTENLHLFSDDDLTSDSAPMLEFVNRREQFVQAITQLSDRSKTLEGQLKQLPPAVSDEIVALHSSIDANLNAIMALDQNSITAVQDNMRLIRTKIGQTHSRKKQISSYLRSELVGIDAHEYDKIK